MTLDPLMLALMKKQLPCYDTRKNFVIETGLQGITPTKIDGFDYYRISDYVPTWDKFIAGTIEISLSGNHAEMPISACSPAVINGFYTTNLYIGVDTDGVRTPKGTYFIAEEGTLDQEILEGAWIKITFPQSGELKTLDPKFLPEPFEVWFSAEDLEGKGYARGYRASDFTEENLLLPGEVYEAYKVGRPLHVRCSSTTIGEEAEWYRLPILGIIALPTESGDEGCMEFIIKTSLSPFGSGATSLAIVEIDIYAE